jgi:predicted GTPase
MSFFEFFETPPAKEFYNGLNKLTADFGEVTKQAETKNQQLNKLIDELGQSIGKITNKQHKKAQKTTLFDLLNAQISLTENTVNSFVLQAQAHSHNTQFRDEFNDSVLIFIYGKVKAGKSSLGNFVAKHPANKKAKPQFFTYDQAGQKQTQAKLEEIHDDSGFETKATEATNCIQGFRAAGLTWIDTPGLHSLTDENGALAQRYVEAADLVLYITSSDSPARASDVAEIVNLVGTKNKSVCIVLSKSDSMEEDEVDGELVQLRIGKSSSNRNLQENHVRNELKKEMGEQLAQRISHIHSCSTLLGLDGINGNKDAWAQSNMDTIYCLLHTEAITNAKANKEKVPRERFNGLISVIVGQKNQRTSALKELFSGLNSLAQQAKNEESALKNRASSVNTQLRAKLKSTVKQCLDRHLQEYGDNENTAKENVNALNQTLTIAITSLVEDALTLAIQQSILDFDEALPLNLQLSQLPDFKERFKEIAVKNNNTGFGAFFGGLIGLAVDVLAMGTTLGAGTAAGAAIGGMLGADSSGVTNTHQKIGDNREEMQQQIISHLEKTLPSLVENQLKTISHDYFSAIHTIAIDIQHQITTFEEKAHALRF